MATFTAVRNKKQTASTMVNVIEYVTPVAKTMLDGRWLVTGNNCVAQSSYLEMVTTKQRFKKEAIKKLAMGQKLSADQNQS